MPPVQEMDDEHNLSDLVGKKIRSIKLREVDVHGDGRNVRQFFTILCTDGDEFVLACDAGSDDNQYATAELWDPDDFAAFLEEIESDDDEDNEDGEDDEDEDSDDEFDDDLEDDGYEEDDD